MDDRYYVSLTPSTWDSTNSWSLTSGGSPGATPPNDLSIAIFDRSSVGLCTVSYPVVIGGLRLSSPYDGTISQNALFIVADASGATMNAGRFASHSDSTFKGTTVITKSFTCDTTATFTGNLSLSGTAFSTGTLEILSGSRFVCTDATVPNLQIKDSSYGTYVEKNGSCLVTNNLSLLSGNIKDGSPSVIHIYKDLNCYAGFGSMTDLNTGVIAFDQSGVNRLFGYGGILPTIRVDKTNSNPVWCYGTNLLMNNFILNDGTFNTNGLDLQVGT